MCLVEASEPGTALVGVAILRLYAITCAASTSMSPFPSQIYTRLIFPVLRWSWICALLRRLSTICRRRAGCVLCRRCAVEPNRTFLLPDFTLISRPPGQAAHFLNLFPDQIHALVEVLHNLSILEKSFVTIAIIIFAGEIFKLLVAGLEVHDAVRKLGVLCVE